MALASVDEVIQLQQRIAPEMAEIIERRFMVLRNLHFAQPIGRRGLAQMLASPERSVRRELDFLRTGGLISVEAGGVRLTDEGEALLDRLADYVRELRGLVHLEKALARRLGLQEAVIVPGDCDRDPRVKQELGRATARLLQSRLQDGQVLAVSGGTTMAEVARAMPDLGGRPGEPARRRTILVVPARGGLGEDVEIQANTIAANMAARLGGNYRLLHVPDGVGGEALSRLLQEPVIAEVVGIIRRADVVLHGIGTAEEMARRRGLPKEQWEYLQCHHAVGEAFGYYFDAQGRTVFVTNSIGLHLEDLAHVPLVISVGGGATKAAPLLAVIHPPLQKVLVTDEGAARKAWELLQRTRPPEAGEREDPAAARPAGAGPAWAAHRRRLESSLRGPCGRGTGTDSCRRVTAQVHANISQQTKEDGNHGKKDQSGN
ncbi:MAG: hypothetical protein IMW99_06390 [Firmicutes bacterium]|nr:hypothetical protein [Bacillota bacterium]